MSRFEIICDRNSKLIFVLSVLPMAVVNTYVEDLIFYRTPLHEAAYFGNLAEVKLLLEFNASIFALRNEGL